MEIIKNRDCSSYRSSRRMVIQILSAAGIFAADASISYARNSTPVALAFPEERFNEQFELFGKSACETDGPTPQRLVGFGDSNMEGTFVSGKRALPTAIVQNAYHRGLGFWEGHCFAYRGATNNDVIENQVRRPDVVAFLKGRGMFNFLVNGGGNDLSYVIKNSEKAQALKDVLENPFQFKTLSLVREIYGVLDGISENFLAVLEAIEQQYSPQINKIEVISGSDFSQTQSIHSDLIDGVSHEYPINSKPAKALVKNGSIVINNGIGEAVYRFSRKFPNRKVRVINAFNMDSKFFMNDEHFNLAGQDEIARRYLEDCKAAA